MHRSVRPGPGGRGQNNLFVPSEARPHTPQKIDAILMKRDKVLDRIENGNESWDFLVIGGGATGLGVAVDASARGYKTLLVEQADTPAFLKNSIRNYRTSGRKSCGLSVRKWRERSRTCWLGEPVRCWSVRAPASKRRQSCRVDRARTWSGRSLATGIGRRF
jgi:FAD dependent oxidoreductase